MKDNYTPRLLDECLWWLIPTLVIDRMHRKAIPFCWWIIIMNARWQETFSTFKIRNKAEKEQIASLWRLQHTMYTPHLTSRPLYCIGHTWCRKDAYGICHRHPASIQSVQSFARWKDCTFCAPRKSCCNLRSEHRIIAHFCAPQKGYLHALHSAKVFTP